MSIAAEYLEPGDTIVLDGEEREVTYAEKYDTQNIYIELGEYTDLIVPAETEFLTSQTIDKEGRIALYVLGGSVAALLGLSSMLVYVGLAGSLIGLMTGL